MQRPRAEAPDSKALKISQIVWTPREIQPQLNEQGSEDALYRACIAWSVLKKAKEQENERSYDNSLQVRERKLPLIYLLNV